MNEERVALFGAVYQTELERAVLAYPEEYTWPVENVPVVAHKTRDQSDLQGVRDKAHIPSDQRLA